MNNTNTVHEQVSALADGHLQDDEFAQVIDKLGVDDDLRATWQTYHLVGDVLRSGVHARCSDTSIFLSRLQGRLAVESMIPSSIPVLPKAAPVRRHVEAANEPVFRWKLVAGAASLAAAAAIGWNWVGVGGLGASGAQLASVQQAAPTVVAAAQPPVQALTPTRVMVGNGSPQIMLRDPRLDQLLEAHQQTGGASQMPSGFLRNATFERPSR
ncbi:sigma-E factor negative regulatory protein [Variovorax sp. J22P240]|uniref:sigma-E factor negative regulatory protein n=1 Tax=unclassified Variovorax TaxID=663243 RepID=UPI002576E093|nr:MULTISPECIES: sigma-E factor negative regulatory protein [unclassified Variovorax]MDL9998410.1 sigma-E factor negative regulatory protein [Variovorax sp. J22P240]MDM0052160.1 sigma-E factor negative regulatory protein [Variovorax sp. J22R115]